MSGLADRVPAAWQEAMVRVLYGLPAPARRALAGKQVEIDGQRLDPDTQLLLKLMSAQGVTLSAETPAIARERLEQSAPLASGQSPAAMETRELRIPGPAGELPARLYTPVGLAGGSGLVVYYHGGGWVIGSIATHDATCRFLAAEGGVRVLSVDYRLAPEHPFPAGADDSLAAFRYAVAHAAELGADPALVAVSGDSAGGNLAAVVCHDTAVAGTERPAFALLFYPAADASTRRASRDLFGKGFFLTDYDMDWFQGRYAADSTQYTDPRMSVLLSDHLAGFPPTYVTVGGFDPLRDESVALGKALAAAGVPAVTRLHPDLIHGFTSFLGVLPRAREATAEAVGALRTGLAMAAAR
ncbi:MAG TPA: alpha/beta hydrolase [Pseudonocardiaceae bacterium]|jgi:acetyl esterase|nr:alpha/beta hydrolase [Pseudonocardiaceae bacterium]